jgi:hypothetical protein
MHPPWIACLLGLYTFTYEVVSKIFRTVATIYTTAVVAWITSHNRPNCEFRVILRRFAVTAWKRTKMSPRTLARTDLAALPWQHPAVSCEIRNGFFPHPLYSPDLAPYDFFLFPKMKGHRFDTTEEIQAKSQAAWHSDRKGLSGSVKKMEETVRPVSACGRELLRGWWRPIGLMVSFIIFYSISLEYFGCTLVLCLLPC